MPFYSVEIRDMHKSIAFYALSRLLHTMVLLEAQREIECGEMLARKRV